MKYTHTSPISNDERRRTNDDARALRAAIDIGTNSILLLIAKVENNELVPVYQEARIARLGKGVTTTSLLSDDAQKRAAGILRDYVRICHERGVTDILACGTAALRNARNARGFVDHINETLGVTINIISEEREALLSFRANTASFGGNIVVMDIGGGSTEFIAPGTPNPTQAISIELGVVALTEAFLHTDPPSPGEIETLRRHIGALLKRKLDQRYYNDGSKRLVAAAGTPTTLAAVRDAIDPYDPARVHGTTLTAGDIDDLTARLAAMTIDERRSTPGLQKGREDVILAGALLLRESMSLLGYEEVTVSDRGVRWGMLLEAQNMKQEARSRKHEI